ncbi:hypothetical protein D3C78_1434830 [compost metagenome]
MGTNDFPRQALQLASLDSSRTKVGAVVHLTDIDKPVHALIAYWAGFFCCFGQVIVYMKIVGVQSRMSWLISGMFLLYCPHQLIALSERQLVQHDNYNAHILE